MHGTVKRDQVAVGRGGLWEVGQLAIWRDLGSISRSLVVSKLKLGTGKFNPCQGGVPFTAQYSPSLVVKLLCTLYQRNIALLQLIIGSPSDLCTAN